MGVQIKLTDTGEVKKLIEYGEVKTEILNNLVDQNIDEKVETAVSTQITALNIPGVVETEVKKQIGEITAEDLAMEPKTYILETNEALETLTDMSVGDIAIIKTLIADDKYSYTGYTYSKIAEETYDWVAMDGNYNANNVYFDTDINITVPVGIITADAISSNDGFVTMSLRGKNLCEVFTGLFSEVKDPIVDYPSVSISVSGGSGEVGTTFTYPTATLKIDDVGSYEYGSKDAADVKYGNADTGVIFEAGKVVLKLDGDNTITNESTMVKGSTMTLQAKSGETTYGDTAITYTFYATADFTESDRVPLNNLGVKVPDKQISSGSVDVAEKTATFSGYRKCFWGYKLTEDALETPAAITSAEVRGLEKSGTNLPTSYTVPAGTKQVFFLAKQGTKTSLSITDSNALNAPVACEKVAGGGTIDAQTGVWVEGANGYAAAAYDLWYVNLDGSFGKDGKLKLAWN